MANRRGDGTASQDFFPYHERQANAPQGEEGVAEYGRRPGATARWRQLGRTIYDLVEPDSHLKERARYLFLFKYALRALPERQVDELVDEIASHFDDEMAHEILVGHDEEEAEARVCARWMAPKKMAVGYAQDAHRKAFWDIRSWLPDLAAAIPLAMVLGPRIPYVVFTQYFPRFDLATAAVITATTGLVAIIGLLRRLPIGPLSRSVTIVLKSLDRWCRIVYAGTTFATITASGSLQVDLLHRAFSVHLDVAHIPPSVAIMIGSMLTLELSRRKGREHRDTLAGYLDNRRFAARQFSRLRDRVREVERKTEYFTEDL